jgi:PAS domain-containing protein
MKIYFDMDGVLFDFVKGFEQATGSPLVEESGKDLVERYELVDADFFTSLPVIREGVELLRRFHNDGFEIEILSSAGDYRTDEVIQQKKSALDMAGLGSMKCHFVMHSKEKARFANDGILIDDRAKAIDPFISAGGKAYLFDVGQADAIYAQVKEECCVDV